MHFLKKAFQFHLFVLSFLISSVLLIGILLEGLRCCKSCPKSTLSVTGMQDVSLPAASRRIPSCRHASQSRQGLSVWCSIPPPSKEGWCISLAAHACLADNSTLSNCARLRCHPGYLLRMWRIHLPKKGEGNQMNVNLTQEKVIPLCFSLFFKQILLWFWKRNEFLWKF